MPTVSLLNVATANATAPLVAPPGGPVAVAYALAAGVLQPGGREARPDSPIGRPACIRAAGLAHEPVVPGPVLGDQGGPQPSGQRGGPDVLDLDLELVLLIGDREPAPVAVLPPPTPVFGVVARTTRRSAAEVAVRLLMSCTSAIMQGSGKAFVRGRGQQGSARTGRRLVPAGRRSGAWRGACAARHRGVRDRAR